MKTNIYALLVAIDDYPNPQHRLNGCRNDRDAFKSFLEYRYRDTEKFALHIKTLSDEEATRQNIIDGYRQHLGQAGSRQDEKGALKQDVALFYFSGHGSREKAADIFQNKLNLESHYNESIVCWDSRIEGGCDLVDKEHGYLLHELDKNNPHVLVVMDCCHSGSGTRMVKALDGEAAVDFKSRNMEDNKEARTADQMLGFEHYVKTADGLALQAPPSSHILLAAAKSHQLAKETLIDGKRQGVFTYSLVRVLSESEGDVSYAELIKRAGSIVSTKVVDQIPQLDAPEHGGYLPFMKGGYEPLQKNNMVGFDQEEGKWVIDMGILQGMPHSHNGSAPTEITLFPPDTTKDEMERNAKKVAGAKVMHTFLTKSAIEFEGGFEPASKEIVYWAYVTRKSQTPVKVYVAEGADAAGTQKLRAAFSPKDDTSIESCIRAVAEENEANYVVYAEAGCIKTRRRGDDSRELLRPIKGFEWDGGLSVIKKQLTAIGNWINVKELENPQTRFFKSPVSIKLHTIEGGAPDAWETKALEPTGGEDVFKLSYNLANGQVRFGAFQIRLKNETTETYHVGLIKLSSQFGIQALDFAYKASSASAFGASDTGLKTLEIKGGEEITVGHITHLKKQAFPGLFYPLFSDDLTTNDISYTCNWLKLIVCNFPIQEDVFKKWVTEQEDLPIAGNFSPRPFRAAPQKHKEDWTTVELPYYTVRPLPPKHIGANDTPMQGLTVKKHTSFAGHAFMCPAETMRMELGKSAYPPALGGDIRWEEVRLTLGFNIDKGAAGIQFIKPANPESVTEANPLALRLNDTAMSADGIVALGIDDRGYHIIGRWDANEIRITRLPEATPSMYDGFESTRKIVFIRLVSGNGSLEDAYKELLKQAAGWVI